MQRIPADQIARGYEDYCSKLYLFSDFFISKFVDESSNSSLGEHINTPLNVILQKQKENFTDADFLYLMVLDAYVVTIKALNLSTFQEYITHLKKKGRNPFEGSVVLKNNVNLLLNDNQLVNELLIKRNLFTLDIFAFGEEFSDCFSGTNPDQRYFVFQVNENGLTVYIPEGNTVSLSDILIDIPVRSQSDVQEGESQEGESQDGVEGVVREIKSFTAKRIAEAESRTRPTSTVSGLSKKSVKQILLASHDITKDILDKTVNNKNLSPKQQRKALKKTIGVLKTDLNASLNDMVTDPSSPYKNMTTNELKQQLLYSIPSQFKFLNIGWNLPMFKEFDELLVDSTKLYKDTLPLNGSPEIASLLEEEEGLIDSICETMFAVFPIHNKVQFKKVYGIEEKNGVYSYIRENNPPVAPVVTATKRLTGVQTVVILALVLLILYYTFRANYYKYQASRFEAEAKKKLAECKLKTDPEKKAECLLEAEKLKIDAESFKKLADDTPNPLTKFMQGIEDLTSNVSNVLIGASWAALAIGIAWGVKEFVIKKD